MPYLIDGHNVIAALPDIDLEDQHDEAKLVLKLRAWTGRRRRKAIVIFDGGIPGGYSRSLSSSAVRVVFAARHHSTADDIIRERLARLPDTPNWTVVSSDHEVLDNARRAGAKTITAQEFADILNQAPDVYKIKPDTISAAEVEAWLREFPEPRPSPEAQPSVPGSTPSSHEKAAARAAPHRRTQRTAPQAKPVRTTRTIGEQTGVETSPPPRPRQPGRRTEKPDDITAAEVDAWLEVFHDPPDSNVPPPTRRTKPTRRRPKPLVVNKDEGLSAEEVDRWLEVFGDLEELPPAPVEKKDTPKARPKARSSGARLVKRKQNLVPFEEEEGAEALSPEDAALWRRMFGKESG